MNHLPYISVDIIRKWSNKCPDCGSRISYRLSNGEYGATSIARCGKQYRKHKRLPER